MQADALVLMNVVAPDGQHNGGRRDPTGTPLD